MGAGKLRGQAEPVAAIIMIGIVLTLSILLLSLFASQYSNVSEERARIEYLNSLASTVDILLVYSSSRESPEGAITCHMVEAVNIGGSKQTLWIAFAWALEASEARIKLAESKVSIYAVKSDEGIFKPPPCGTLTPLIGELIEVGRPLPISKIMTREGLRLDEVGNNPNINVNYTIITLNPGESKTLYVQYTGQPQGGYPLAIIMGSFNNKYYMASYRILPSY
ncbi:MAG: hypothetical protein P3X22_007925 [Thermoprotei archaeon]|nr:hypothetical protein [Thermoprotei archaeon]